MNLQAAIRNGLLGWAICAVANAACAGTLPSTDTPVDAAPAIDVVSLQAGPVGVNPLRIHLAFVASGHAHIVPASFHVYYGFFRIDITEQVLKRAQLTEDGLVAESSAVPEGNHRLFVQIADDRGRVREEEIRFRVEAQ